MTTLYELITPKLGEGIIDYEIYSPLSLDDEAVIAVLIKWDSGCSVRYEFNLGEISTKLEKI